MYQSQSTVRIARVFLGISISFSILGEIAFRTSSDGTFLFYPFTVNSYDFVTLGFIIATLLGYCLSGFKLLIFILFRRIKILFLRISLGIFVLRMVVVALISSNLENWQLATWILNVIFPMILVLVPFILSFIFNQNLLDPNSNNKAIETINLHDLTEAMIISRNDEANNSSVSLPVQLEKLFELRMKSAISEEEFTAAKKRVLGH